MMRFTGMLLLATLCQSCHMMDGYVTTDVTFGKAFASSIHLPDGTGPSVEALPRTSLGRFSWQSHFEFRGTPEALDRLLVRIFDKTSREYTEDPPKNYSKRAFALDCTGKAKATIASEAEWSGAQALDTISWDRLPPNPFHQDAMQEAGGHSWQYQGHRFPSTGDTYYTFLLSPTHKRVAVLSYSGNGKRPLIGNLPDAFTYYVEIYDARSAKHLATAQGFAKGMGVNGFFQTDQTWVTDRYFVFPTTESRDQMLLFDFDRN
jgi:hypothetical protein